MAKTNKLVTLIREMVRQEVKKEVNKIFINEGIKSMSQKSDYVPEVLPVSKNSKPKEVSYTKNPTLNKILNETARGDEFEEYPTMGNKTFDSTRMAEAMGYGGMLGSAEEKRKMRMEEVMNNKKLKAGRAKKKEAPVRVLDARENT